jgi:hypothetical protein
MHRGDRRPARDGGGEMGGGEGKGDGEAHSTLVGFSGTQGRCMKKQKFLARRSEHCSGVRRGVGAVENIYEVCFL